MHLSVPSMLLTWQNIEILRDGSGDLVDLLCIQGVVEGRSNLLPSFLAGIDSAKYTDDQLEARFGKQGGK